MPNIRQTVKRMLELEGTSPKTEQEGYYPIMFKNDWKRLQFIMLLKWELWKRKVKAKCHR